MGFLDSYRRLPRYQRVLLGLVGITVGWCGPSFMQYLFVDPGVLRARPRGSRAIPPAIPTNQNTTTSQLPLTDQSLPSIDTSSRNNN